MKRLVLTVLAISLVAAGAWWLLSPDGESAAWIESLRSTDDHRRSEAVRGVLQLPRGTRARVFAGLAILLEDSRWEARVEAALVLSELAAAMRERLPSGGPTVPWDGSVDELNPCLPALRKRLSDEPYMQVQLYAAITLARCGADKARVVEHLLRLIKTDEGTVRYRALECLREIGPEAGAVVPDMRYLLIATQGDSWVPQGIIQILDALPEYKGAALAEVTRMVRERDTPCRVQAARILGHLAADSEPALEELAVLVGDQDPAVRTEATTALRRLGPRGIRRGVEELVRLAGGSDPAARDAAIQAAGILGPQAKRTVEATKPH